MVRAKSSLSSFLLQASIVLSLGILANCNDLIPDTQQVIGDSVGSFQFGIISGEYDTDDSYESDIERNSGRNLEEAGEPGFSTESAPSSPIGTRPPAWYGRFDPIYKRAYFAPAIAQNTCVGKPGRQCREIPGLNLSYPYEEYILDPTTNVKPQPVMKVHFPAGSISAGAVRPGGTLFFAYPFKYHPTNDKGNAFSHTKAYLEYEVYFPPDFDWVKGGKLPGLSGGSNNGRSCGGGVDADWCFNFRIMWRKEGFGEAYLYIPEGMQADDFCTRLPKCAGSKKPNCIYCNFDAGISWGRGSFIFKRGEWNTIRLGLQLNTPNKTDGIMEVWHNGKRAIFYDKINWRQKYAAVEAVEVVTFYGGSDTSWAPSKPQHLLFRNFRAWRGDAPRRTSTQSFTRSVEQVVVDIEVEEDRALDESD